MATALLTFDEAAHRYVLDGLTLPSVTQVLKGAGLISFDGIPWATLERKRQLGTLVHKVTEIFDRGEDLSEYDIPDEVMQYVEGYANFRNDCSFFPERIEHRMMGEISGMKFGGTLDRAGEINGAPHIIELKTCYTKSPVWGVQMFGYAWALAGEKWNRYHRAAVQLSPAVTRGYRIHSYDDPTDSQVFQSALALVTWKQNKGLVVTEDVPERLEL